MNYFKLAKKLENKKRYRHTKRVVKLAVKLGRIHKAPVEKIRIAAILHDITKIFSSNYQIETLKEYNETRALMLPASLYHAYTGYIYVKEELAVQDDDILLAIRHHPLGRPNMTDTEKIIFLADYFEHGRKFIEAKIGRRLAKKDLDEAVIYKCKSYFNYHKKLDEQIPDEMVETYNFYKNKRDSNSWEK